MEDGRLVGSAMMIPDHFRNFIKFTGLPPQRVMVAYAESYLMVRYLVDGYGSDRATALLYELAGGATIDEAFDAVLGFGVGAFENDTVTDLVGG